MERLDSFVAGGLLRRLHQSHPGNGAEPLTASFPAVVLFVDISGYTRLAEALCDEGPSGVERLGRILDRVFRASVEAVHDTKGEVAGFAGDAFIAYWTADSGESRARAWADACARRLHSQSRSTPHTAESAMPQLHIGIASGQVWAALLGDEQRQQLLIAGAPVRRAYTAVAAAAAGTTVVAPGTWPGDPLLPAIDPDGLDDASVDAPATLETSGLLRHVPRRVQDYREDRDAAWTPQRRPICALFVRITGLDEGTSDAAARHQALVTSLHNAVRPFSSSSGTLVRDDQGLVFTLCIGMPDDTGADDVVRAVRAGFAIQAALSRLALESAAGVADGPGICMELGGPQRRNYWPVGRFMHVAARFMDAAGRDILCTASVAGQARHAVRFGPERVLQLKGLGPVVAFPALDALAADSHSEALFGRAEQQAELEGCLTRFESGDGTVLAIVGKAGLGKTALVHHLHRAAAQRGIPLLAGGAESFARASRRQDASESDTDDRGLTKTGVAYAAFRPVFAMLFGDPDPLTRSSPAQRLARLAAIRHPQLSPLINAVLPGFLEDTPLTQSLVGQARADATLTVLSDALSSQATDRFVLVIEDCHWMDSASWRLLNRVALDYPSAFIVLTSWPSDELHRLATLRERVDPPVQEPGAPKAITFVEMRLPEIRSREVITELVQHVLGTDVDPALVDEIARHTDGTPLYAREFALLRDGQSRQPETGASRNVAGGLAQEDLKGPEGLIARRLDPLENDEELALQAAAVIGQSFDVDMLLNVFPDECRPDTMTAILASLERQQLIARAETESSSFAFQHALIRKVTYGRLVPGQLQRLHRLAAVGIERKHEGDLQPFLGTLAYHWSCAEARSETIKYSDQAATQALAAGAFEEAERLLSQCVDRTTVQHADVPSFDRIRWQRQLADARVGLGQPESRRSAAHQALRLAGVPRPRSPVRLVAQAAFRLGRLRLNRLMPRRHADDQQAHTLNLALAYRHSAEVCYFNNDMLGMICDSVSAVASASRLPPSAVLAGASTELGGILSVAGLRRIGERILQRAIAMAETVDDTAAQAYAHMISCLYFVGIGDWRSAQRSAERCQALCEPLDDRVNWTNAQAVRFWMSHYQSLDDAALEAAQRLQQRAAETGNRQHRSWAYRFLGLCELRRQRTPEALAEMRRARACLDETAALNDLIPTLGILALAQLQSGDRQGARLTADEALKKARQVGRPIGHSTLEGYSALATVVLDAWTEERSTRWRSEIDLCLGILDRYRRGFPVGEARYQLHLGHFRRLSGAASPARRSYRRGEAAASRLGMPWDLRQCQDGLAALSGGPQSGLTVQL